MRDLGLRQGELDLLVGGPPCQSYSTAGKRGGVEDVRGLMLWQYLWFIEAMRPKAWILENVTGLLSTRLSESAEKGSLLERFLSDLPGEYRVDVFRVNAADHGVAQLRERVFLVGNRLGRAAEFPPPTHGPAGSDRPPHRTLREALAGLADLAPVTLPFAPHHREALDLIPPGGSWLNLPPEVARRLMGKAYSSTKGGRTGWFRRLSWDRPSPTVLTGPNHTMTCLCHPDETRTTSVAECACIQGYPDDWVFVGTADERFTQIGNAVPPGLGSAVGLAVAGLLDGGRPAEGLDRFRIVDLARESRMSLRRRKAAAS